jgi:uncharacterized OsmC-like protein
VSNERPTWEGNVSEEIVNTVHSYSTGTPGRSLNSVRGHHFVIDEPAYADGPGEEITPGEAFLAGVSACGVLIVERHARRTGARLVRAEVTITGLRNKAEPSKFERVDLRFELIGPTQEQAEALVEQYKSS